MVPFYMTNVGLGLPALPWLSAFPELNVRTYVRVADRPGVLLQPGRWAPARRRGGAGVTQPAACCAAAMSVERREAAVHYQSARRSRRPCGVQRHLRTCRCALRGVGGSIEYFLTERYCLYHHDRRGRPTVWRFTTGRGPSRSHMRRSQ